MNYQIISIYENPEYKEFMKLLAESDKDAFRKNE